MDLNARIEAFVRLGEWLLYEQTKPVLTQWAVKAQNENSWFTTESVHLALENVARSYLNQQALFGWANHYPGLSSLETHPNPLAVGVIMAGNVPAVGFHDALCVLLAGHRLLAKLSSQDSVLMRALLGQLIEIEPRFGERITLVERLNDAEAVIATGSDNSARYFEYYFGKKPHLIRKNRTSVALLTGLEPVAELRNLGSDILTYFGLGCRNVSKLYVPEDYRFDEFYEAIEPLADVVLQHKYHNNYDYNKSVMLVNQTPFLDNGFLMITENVALVSSVSVVHFERCPHLDAAKEAIRAESERIQCVVTAGGWLPGSVPFGGTQSPSLPDYADGVDTMEFLTSLSD